MYFNGLNEILTNFVRILNIVRFEFQIQTLFFYSNQAFCHLWRSSQEGILENLLDFFQKVWIPFKIHQRFNYWICSRIFNFIFFGIWSRHNWENCSEFCKLASWKNWEFLEHDKACRHPSPATDKPSSEPPPPSLLPPIRSATLLACSPATTALTTGRRSAGFYQQATGADRGGSLPSFSVVGQKAIWARLPCRARPRAYVDPSPLQMYHFVFFLLNYSNSILIKVQTS
jgi:hypothetical protein